MTTLTEEAREKLEERLKSLEEQEGAIHKAMTPFEEALKPFRDALAAIDTVKQGLIEDAGIEIIGNCETCDCLLIEGDLGHRCNDGPVLCEACSPTWQDLLNQYSEPSARETAEDPEAFDMGLQAAQENVAAGLGDQKHVLPL